MSSIILPAPDNVRGKFGAYVTGDVYRISERIREEVIDGDRLHIETIDPPIQWQGREYNFAVVEETSVGPRLVMRVKELDARIIAALQRMIKIPFKQRFEEAEKLAEQWEAEEKDRQLNELYERMGGNMRHQLARCNFTDPWGPSYTPMNRTARRHRNAR